MNVPSERFAQAVQSAWGNPEHVAKAGLNETFGHGDVFGQDYDDQIDNAIRIGILAGQSTSPKAFIEGFTAMLNED